MSEFGPDREDVVVVGAGLAGLAAGVRLSRRGRRVCIVDAEVAPGGRARTDWHEGRPVDRGFQVAFSAYPQFRKFVREVGIPRDDLRPFAGGAAFYDGVRWSQLAPTPRGLAGFAGLGSGDRARLARLAAEVRFVPGEVLLKRDGQAASTEAFLRDRGFSAQAIETVFRPLFGVIFLDRTLSADPGYFQFLLSMLVRGPAVLPSDGLGMVADWAAGAVRQAGGRFELGTPVASLVRDADGSLTGVRLEDLRQIHARTVVLAVEAPAARRLLSPIDPQTAERIPHESASVTTARFALTVPLYRGRVILLNAAPDAGPRPRIDLLCQTTNVTRHGASGGPHIVLASSVGDSEQTAVGIEDAVERQIARWYPEFPWSRVAHPLGVIRHPHAQFRPLAGVRRGLPGPRTNVANLILAGDVTTHPSLEGAVVSGVRAADIVDRQLG